MISAGGYTLDTHQRLLWRNGCDRPAPLTPLVAILARSFLENAGRPLDAENIGNAVYEGHPPSLAAVRTLVAILRRTMARLGGGRRDIATVPGGWVFLDLHRPVVISFTPEERRALDIVIARAEPVAADAVRVLREALHASGA